LSKASGTSIGLPYVSQRFFPHRIDLPTNVTVHCMDGHFNVAEKYCQQCGTVIDGEICQFLLAGGIPVALKDVSFFA